MPMPIAPTTPSSRSAGERGQALGEAAVEVVRVGVVQVERCRCGRARAARASPRCCARTPASVGSKRRTSVVRHVEAVGEVVAAGVVGVRLAARARPSSRRRTRRGASSAGTRRADAPRGRARSAARCRSSGCRPPTPPRARRAPRRRSTGGRGCRSVRAPKPSGSEPCGARDGGSRRRHAVAPACAPRHVYASTESASISVPAPGARRARGSAARIDDGRRRRSARAGGRRTRSCARRIVPETAT